MRDAQRDDQADAVRLRGRDDGVEVLQAVRARVDRRRRAVPDLVVRDAAARRRDLVEAPAAPKPISIRFSQSVECNAHQVRAVVAPVAAMSANAWFICAGV